MTNMNATFGFSMITLRKTALAAVLLGSTMLVVASPAHAGPVAQPTQATVMADTNDAGEGASFRVSDTNDAGEGASFRVSDTNDAGEGASFRVSDTNDAGEGAAFPV